MNKALYIFLLTAALTVTAAITAAAQVDFDEPKWTKFEPPKEEFSINFPSPNVVSSRWDAEGVISGRYRAVASKTLFTVFSDSKSPESFLRQLVSLAIEAPTPSEIEIDGIKGQRYDFKGTDDYEHSFIAIQAPVNFYVFDVISEIRANPMIEEFLKSIKLNRQIENPEKPATSVTSPISAAARNDILKSPAAGGMSAGGFGGEMGRAPQPLDTVAPPKYAKVDSPVAILSKAPPSYTELARQFQVSGTVKLRVTFEKNKEIGNITVLARLPLGLTQNAISAARQIKFSPAMRKGEPYAITKVVEYNFLLY